MSYNLSQAELELTADAKSDINRWIFSDGHSIGDVVDYVLSQGAAVPLYTFALYEIAGDAGNVEAFRATFAAKALEDLS